MLDDRFVSKAEAATDNNGDCDGEGDSNAMLVSCSQTIPEATCLDRPYEEAGSSTIATSAKHAVNNLHQSSRNEGGSDSWEEREGNDQIPQKRNCDNHVEAGAGSRIRDIGEEVESGLGWCSYDDSTVRKLTRALDDSPYVLVQRSC